MMERSAKDAAEKARMEQDILEKMRKKEEQERLRRAEEEEGNAGGEGAGVGGRPGCAAVLDTLREIVICARDEEGKDVHKCFEHFDADFSGHIDREEFQKGLTALGVDTPAPRAPPRKDTRDVQRHGEAPVESSADLITTKALSLHRYP